ncbi:IclR family transcriptional regulator [Natronolimnohabitans innermongolicus]|uniref:Transcriptional regulator n=1 Tax=Natronolimnohabitans innermongolicus JCM 12255 TaxID=1227499 RepID=L9XNH5_9EURY|nr:IclR family transcriptional regulator [Natronolimnohabitans innermongolicus]ELY62198.1 transcriptional regulator [Natronolimnohabitans innermongolicus JCM 12255]
MEKRTRPSQPVTTTQTSFEVFELIKERDGLTLSELDAELDLAKSTLHRHLATLEDLGYLVRDDDTYRVGLWFLDLGFSAMRQNELYQVGKDLAENLAEQTEHTVWLSAEQNGLAVHIHKAVGGNPFQNFANVGKRRLLHPLAGGKAILAFLPEERVRSIVDRHGLPARTENTITDEAELFEMIERTRERGYSVQFGEAIVGLNGVGAPIRLEGEVVGAIAIAGAANRIPRAKIHDELAEQVLAIANEIEVNLRYS